MTHLVPKGHNHIRVLCKDFRQTFCMVHTNEPLEVENEHLERRWTKENANK